MFAFVVKKMLPAAARHAMQEYAADKDKSFRGEKRTAVMRDGFEAEYLFFPAKRPNAPLLVDFFGGGYIGGNVYKEIELCERYRDTLDMNVAALSYRYGPEHHHPQSMLDAYDALSALMDDDSLNFDRDRIVLEGHSAGAHLVASVALYNQKERNFPLKGLILNYPFFDLRKKSLAKLPKIKYALSPLVCELMYHAYVADETTANDPYVSQILASDEQLHALPAMYINTCEHDNLKFLAQAFCRKLDELGVSYTAYEEKGAVHGYVEHCSTGVMRTLKGYPSEMNEEQFRLYEKAFARFCEFIVSVTEKG